MWRLVWRENPFQASGHLDEISRKLLSMRFPQFLSLAVWVEDTKLKPGKQTKELSRRSQATFLNSLIDPLHVEYFTLTFCDNLLPYFCEHN
jgi:hypothetical protein